MEVKESGKLMALGITLGDPAGIGPEIVAKALSKFEKNDDDDDLILFGSKDNFEQILSLIKIQETYLPRNVQFVDVGLARPSVELGKLSKTAGLIALESIRKAVAFALEDKIDALVTAPINKEAIIQAGSKFIDHTAMLQALTKAKEVSTVFETGTLRVLFMTKHVPLREAVSQVTKERVYEAILLAKRNLELLGIENGKIALAALNPHGGDGGILGKEEIEELEPAVKKAATTNSINVSGPYPADSVFHRAANGEFDLVVSLYHDQGHIATKMLDFSGTVSMNLGLPFLRTSVDHGTAFDIAGKGVADETSMIQAIRVAKHYDETYKKNYARVYG